MMHTLQFLPDCCPNNRAPSRRKSRAIKIQPPSAGEAAALAAMTVARSKPRALTDDQCAAHYAFRARAHISPYVTKQIYRRGRPVFRRAGYAGADLSIHPAEWDAQQALAAFLAMLARTFRKPPHSTLGVEARRNKAQQRAARVLSWLEDYAERGRNRAALMARASGEPIAYVRRVLKSVHDANRQ